MLWFTPKRPTPTEAARVLSELSCLSDRERIRARTRMMRADMGLPPINALRPRG